MDSSQDDTGKQIGLAVAVIALVLVLVYLLREFVCWFYKLNALHETCRKNNVLLRRLVKHSGNQLVEPART